MWRYSKDEALVRGHISCAVVAYNVEGVTVAGFAQPCFLLTLPYPMRGAANRERKVVD